MVSAFTVTGLPEACTFLTAAATAAAFAVLSGDPGPGPIVARFFGCAGVLGSGAARPAARSGPLACDDTSEWLTATAATDDDVVLSATTAVTAMAHATNLA